MAAAINFNDLETTFSVPIVFQGEDGKTLNDLLPWFDVFADCEVNQMIYAVETLYHGNVCPPILELQSLHAPWDTKLDEEHHYHWLITEWDAFTQLRTQIGDDTVDLAIDGFPWTHRL